MKIDLEKLAVDCCLISNHENLGAYKNHPLILISRKNQLAKLQAFAEAVASEVKAENEALKADLKSQILECQRLTKLTEME